MTLAAEAVSEATPPKSHPSTYLLPVSEPSVTKMSRQQDEGDIQVTIPYRYYRRLFQLAQLKGKRLEDLLEEQLENFLAEERNSATSG